MALDDVSSDMPAPKVYVPLEAGPGQRLVTLTRGFVARIDESDWSFVSLYMWHTHKGRSKLYARSRDAQGKVVYMHRLLLGVNDPSVLVDHDDLDGLNNCRYNLSEIGRGGNAHKAVYDGTSGFRGVTFDTKLQKYRARIQVDGKQIYLGVFDRAKDAGKAYDAAAIEHYGADAMTNKKVRAVGPVSCASMYNDVPF